MDKILDCSTCFNENSSIFAPLSEEQRFLIEKEHSCAFYKKGEYIYKEAEKPTGLICLAKGKVKVFKEGLGGRDQIVRMAKPNGFIGYRALFAGDNYRASAVAIEDSVVFEISKTVLFRVLEENPRVMFRLNQVFAQELGLSNERMLTLTQKHIRGRLAESLLLLRDTFGFEDDGSTLKVYLSREDVANLSNMTTSNAIRTLSIFATENVITLDGRRISIIDMPKLERISALG